MEPTAAEVEWSGPLFRSGLLLLVGLLLILGLVADVIWVPLVAHHPLVLAWISGRLGHLVLAGTRTAFLPFAAAMAVRAVGAGSAAFALGRRAGEARFRRASEVSGLFARPERIMPVVRRIGVPLMVAFPTIPVAGALGAAGEPVAVFAGALLAGVALRIAIATAAVRLLGHQLTSVVEALSNRQWLFVAAGAALVAWHVIRMQRRRKRASGG